MSLRDSIILAYIIILNKNNTLYICFKSIPPYMIALYK